MNALDLIMLGIIISLAAWGAWIGLIKSVFRLGALLGGAIAAYVWGLPATTFLGSFLPFAGIGLAILGRGMVFVIVFLAISLTGDLLHRLTHLTPLGLLDRVGGAALGGIKGILVACLIAAVLVWIPATKPLANGSFLWKWGSAAIDWSRLAYFDPE